MNEQEQGGSPFDVDIFLTQVYTLDDLDDKLSVRDLVMDTIIRLRQEQRFDAVNAIVEGLDHARVSVYVLNLVIGLTYTSREHLPGRDAFFDRAYTRIVELRGSRKADTPEALR